MNVDRLALDLDAFYLEHRRCGHLDANVDEGAMWFKCECGAVIARRVTVENER